MGSFKNSGIENTVIEHIRSIAKECGVEKLYLFGSRGLYRGTVKWFPCVVFTRNGCNEYSNRMEIENDTSKAVQLFKTGN